MWWSIEQCGGVVEHGGAVWCEWLARMLCCNTRGVSQAGCVCVPLFSDNAVWPHEGGCWIWSYYSAGNIVLASAGLGATVLASVGLGAAVLVSVG